MAASTLSAKPAEIISPLYVTISPDSIVLIWVSALENVTLFFQEPFVLGNAQYMVPEETFSLIWPLVHVVPPWAKNAHIDNIVVKAILSDRNMSAGHR